MEEKKKPFRVPPLMTPEQIADIKAEIKDYKDMINSADESRKGDVGYFQHSSKHIVDPEDVRKAIVSRETQLKKFTPTKITGEKANKLLAWAKNRRQWIIANMPKETYALYPRGKDPVDKASEFERAVQRQVKWDQSGGSKAIEEYHYVMKRLDPDAPREDFNRFIRERA
jgi:hypothetical protein